MARLANLLKRFSKAQLYDSNLHVGKIVAWRTEIFSSKSEIADPKSKIKVYVLLELIKHLECPTMSPPVFTTKTISCIYDMRFRMLRTLDGWPLSHNCNCDPINLTSVLNKVDEQIESYFSNFEIVNGE